MVGALAGCDDDVPLWRSSERCFDRVALWQALWLEIYGPDPNGSPVDAALTPDDCPPRERLRHLHLGAVDLAGPRLVDGPRYDASSDGCCYREHVPDD